MTLTSRIRTCLILIAILPVMIVMIIIWNQFGKQAEQEGHRLAQTAIERFQILEKSLGEQLLQSAKEYATQTTFRQTVRKLSGKDVSRLTDDPKRYTLDFAEIIQADDKTVRASYHRSGLLGRKLERPLQISIGSLPQFLETVEYDLNGPHASLTCVISIGDNLLLYAGRYLDRELLGQMTDMSGSVVNLIVEPETTVIYSEMINQTLYQTDSGLEAVLIGSDSVGFYLVTSFDKDINETELINLLGLAGLVGLLSVTISIGIGIFITGRAKREIENLVQATDRVSKGDLNTPIMAFEEGEFSELADSFSQMMVDLKKSRIDLAESEKIAAWQIMGRKIAHEIKNPMTPIAISAEDLRRSYHEKLPGFDQILNQTTGTIISEVDRLARLLDQFVSFAKMAPPNIQPTDIKQMINELSQLYHQQITDNSLIINNQIETVSFKLDRDNIRQVLINLIKNSFESGDNIKVMLTAQCKNDIFSLRVEDNGPGFPDHILANSLQPQISKKKNGSGLGLVICHRIIRDHNGQLIIYNQPKGGAGVSIEIPG